MKKETFKDLSIRARMGYLTALISFSAGWFLTCYNFFASDDCAVQDSTLFILAQALTYTGAVIGITEYVKGEFRNFKQEQRKILADQKTTIEPEAEEEEE